MQTEENAAEQNVTPTASTEQAQQPAQEVSTEPGAEQTAVEQTEQAQQEKPKNDWVQRRIDQLTREKHEEKRQREALEQQLQQYRQPAETTQQPAQRQMSADDVRAEAKRLIQQEKFDEACNKVFDAGKTEFSGDWDSSLRTFQMLGGASPEFLEAVTSMDAGHKVLHHLGQNPDVAERVLSLPPLRMALELARLESTVGQAKPKPVSNAPAPINPIGGRSAPVEPEEFATTAEQIAWWKKHGSK
jgi:DNA polymerase III gamma/tau subunit